MKKKVTLSIDSKVYKEFQEFCEKNAIMLSRKIELIMEGIMKEDKDFEESKKELAKKGGGK